jgi:acyl-CoA synthetase (AMP-forming)/AMP-acid ligase II
VLGDVPREPVMLVFFGAANLDLTYRTYYYYLYKETGFRWILDLEPTSSTRARTCATTEVARYKIPEAWRFVESLPGNAMGKLIRRDLAQILNPAVEGCPCLT